MLIKRTFQLTMLSLVVAVLGLAYLVASSLPKMEGSIALAGLHGEVAVDSDAWATPDISAKNRSDAYRVLGYLHARDRLFQMELMRRKSAGRLAELFGSPAAQLDVQQRKYQFESAAKAIVDALPSDSRQVLQAYVDGVNAYLQRSNILPPEFLILHHTPETWRPEDSLLVALGMFQTLGDGQEQDERMLSVMEKALPPELTAFLTPDEDPYARVLLGGRQSRRPARPIPGRVLAQLRHSGPVLSGAIDVDSVIAGSNNWAVAGQKTRDGRAIVANDMHLSLGVPNIWYRAALNYQGKLLTGVTLPGLPLLVVGSNGRIAWGFTNVDADVLDLIKLELNPDNPSEYRTAQGWRLFETRTETIRVKDAKDLVVPVKLTHWGPVSPQQLLGQPVALHWTALDPAAVDLGLLDMDRAETLEQAIAVMNRAGSPAQNVVMADDQGHIAWTLMGRFPNRQGFDGSSSRGWTEPGVGWQGYIHPADLPRIVDPSEGYLVTANNRTLGREYPHVIGHNYANGYRAYRIAERLQRMDKVTEQDFLDLQLDTRSGFYDFYQQLALQALDDKSLQDPALREIKTYLGAWNGKMDRDSLGIGLLIPFRQKLAETVFAPAIQRCRQVDPDFKYAWRQMDTPLRALLEAKLPDTLPDEHYASWQALIVDVLKNSAAGLKQQHSSANLSELTWGKINRLAIRHPFSKMLPALSWLLDMPEADSPGCRSACVRIIGGGHGASERMAVSPGHFEDGILHMPAGQSGHILSPHYRDQQAAWESGKALAFLPGASLQRIVFHP